MAQNSIPRGGTPAGPTGDTDAPADPAQARGAPADAARDAAAVALLHAYRTAHYAVQLDGHWHPLRVGQPAPAGLERALPGTTRTLVTAWNPQSVPRAEAANLAADATLKDRIDALGLPRWPARSESAGGSWHEPGWLVAGLEVAAADRLAIEFGQAGILHWRQGDPVRLRMYREATPAWMDC